MKCRYTLLGGQYEKLKERKKRQQNFGFLYLTLMPYIIGHKHYFIWY